MFFLILICILFPSISAFIGTPVSFKSLSVPAYTNNYSSEWNTEKEQFSWWKPRSLSFLMTDKISISPL